MEQQPGWFPDPYGRFQRRYHDGVEWTEHVADDGVEQQDPMRASPVVPFVLPRTAVAGAAPWPPPDPEDRQT